MPHLTLEYSANVAEHHDIDALVDTIHQAALNHGLAAVAGLRTRAAMRHHYAVADGDPANAFIAIVARIGPGRSIEQRQSFIVALLDAAEARLASEAGPLTIAWSMEVTELDPDFRVNRNRVKERIEASL